MPPVAGFVAGLVGITGIAGSATWGGWLVGMKFAATAFGGIVSQMLTTVAISALQSALTKRPDQQGGGIAIKTTLRGEDNPETIILGLYATGGQAICPPMSHGKDRRYLTHVIELCSAPGATLERLIINDAYAELGAAHPDYGRKITAEGYEGEAWIRYYDGSQTAAGPMLLAKYGDDPDRPWTADMVGAGLCYAILTFTHDPKKQTSVPRYRFEMGGIPLPDPREIPELGGSGSQRLDDPSTWTQTTNAGVIAWNIHRGITLPGGLIWGGRAEADELPPVVWNAAMTSADAPEEFGEGTEPRYRAGIEASLGQEPAAVLEEVYKAASGTVADIAGVWKVRFGAPSLPVSVREVDASDYVWSGNCGLPRTPAAISTTLPSPVVSSGFGAKPAILTDGDAVGRRPGIRMSWDPELIADGLEWKIRLAATGTVVLRGTLRELQAGWHVVWDGLLPDTDYQARGRPVLERETSWSAWFTEGLGGGGGGYGGYGWGGTGTSDDTSRGDRHNGKDSVAGTGGAGGVNGAPTGSNATGYGAGGGGGYNPSGKSGQGGEAASPVTTDWIDVSGWAAPKIQITMGAGGAGHAASGVFGAGGKGSPGRVVYQRKDTADIPASVLPLQCTSKGSFNKTASAAGTLPNLGPGLWVLTTGDTNAMQLGNITCHLDGTQVVGNAPALTFLADVDQPSYSGGANARTIYFRHYAMGKWGS